MRNLAGVMLVCVLGACGDSMDADLPAGWEAATRLEKLVQMPCSQSGLDVPETVTQGALGSELSVTYGHAHFRCEQPVEGFVRTDNGSLAVLVQPIDMDPDAVAGCDCRYTIEMQVPVEPNTHKLKLFRRWDNHNDPNNPVEIGELTF